MTSAMPDPAGFLAPIEQIAHRAGEIHLRHFRKLSGYEKKGAIDLLTIADQEAEAAVVAAIAELFPSHRVLGEEGGTQGGDANSDFLWIVDPVDGTTNYAHGLPFFAVSIAVRWRDVTLAGAVHAAALGETYLAARGHGTTRNRAPLRVSQVGELSDALVVTGFPYNRVKLMDHLMGCFREFLTNSQGVVRLGAASLDLALIAGGNLDAMYEVNLQPWDMAAGQLLIEEAGGKVTRYDGAPLDLWGKQLVATNGKLHDEVIRRLAEHPVQ